MLISIFQGYILSVSVTAIQVRSDARPELEGSAKYFYHAMDTSWLDLAEVVQRKMSS